MATRGTGTSNRGFASMDPEKQRSIAAQGGRAAHAQGVAHEFDSEEARAAGRKGGQARSSRSAASRAANLASADRDIQEAPPVSPMHAMSDELPRGGHV
jgi:general stress protein YciG